MSLRVAPALVVAVAASEAERALGRAIRQVVFVEEQHVPAELELDGLDADCQHFLVWLELAADGVAGAQAVATARARATPKGWKIERVAVLREHRGRAVGAALVRRMQAEAPAELAVYVHAQESALGFWQRLGFVVEGSRFFEAGIPHHRMVWAR